MDDLQRLLNEFGDLIKADLADMAKQQGLGDDFNIRLEELGMIFVSTALAYAVNMGTSKDVLKQVIRKCFDSIPDEEDNKPKIIC